MNISYLCRIGIHHLVSHVDPLISIGLKTVLLFGVMDDELKVKVV